MARAIEPRKLQLAAISLMMPRSSLRCYWLHIPSFGLGRGLVALQTQTQAKRSVWANAISQITAVPPVVALNRSSKSQIAARYAAFWHAAPKGGTAGSSAVSLLFQRNRPPSTAPSNPPAVLFFPALFPALPPALFPALSPALLGMGVLSPVAGRWDSKPRFEKIQAFSVCTLGPKKEHKLLLHKLFEHPMGCGT